jgi:O-methyltransferase
MPILSTHISEQNRLLVEHLCCGMDRDPVFVQLYSDILRFAPIMVDGARSWLLFELIRRLSSTPAVLGSFLEVGSWRGGSGALIAKTAEHFGLVSPVYLCDTFKGVPKASAKDNVYVGGEHADTSLEQVQALMATLGLTNVSILAGIFPDETGHHIDRDEKFRFCHIDVDTYLSAKDSLDWVWPRMEKGSIVVYDDYGHGVCAGVRAHVDEHCGDVDKIIFMHPITTHAVMIKI